LQKEGKYPTKYSQWKGQWNGTYFKDIFNASVLTEEDILKYAPYSLSAYEIK
jgi:hypothetical protein